MTTRPPGSGTGLRGEYYGPFGLRMLRTDPTIAFNWGHGAPHPALDRDSFTVRWTGSLEPRFSEVYTFYTVADDGIRVWLDDLLIIDEWTTGNIVGAINFYLFAGAKVDIRVEYREGLGTAYVALLWVSTRVPLQIVPRSQLYPSTSRPPWGRPR